MTQTDALDRFRGICREKGIAATQQRYVVYRCVLDSRDHPSPEQIYERVRRDFSFISLATIYKCLHTFIAVGLLKPASLHHGPIRVDAVLSRHHHVVCKVCGSITDIPEDQVLPPRFTGKLPRGFQLETIDIELTGTCADCHTA